MVSGVRGSRGVGGRTVRNTPDEESIVERGS